MSTQLEKKNVMVTEHTIFQCASRNLLAQNNVLHNIRCVLNRSECTIQGRAAIRGCGTLPCRHINVPQSAGGRAGGPMIQRALRNKDDTLLYMADMLPKPCLQRLEMHWQGVLCHFF